jgi:NAD-dependent dihydropyrimidine dehydrogenase PreA subunit
MPIKTNSLKITVSLNTFSVMAKVQKKGNYAIEIDYSLCGNCGACVAVCPENVLHLGTVMLTSDDDECTGCKHCIITCPSDALILQKKSWDTR